MDDVKIGDTIRKGNKFYRVHDFAKHNDVVCNEIVYHPKKEYLIIVQDYTYININDIGFNKPYKVITENVKEELEVVKRKYKLLKLLDV